MDITFTIDDGSINEIKTFNKNIKALSKIAPQQVNSIFVVANNELTIYSLPDSGSAGFAKIHVPVMTTDEGKFVISIDAVLSYITNLQGPSYLCHVTDDKFNICSAAFPKPAYSRVLTSSFSLDSEIAEAQNRFVTPETDGVLITADFIGDCAAVAATTAVFNRSQAILIKSDSIESSDDAGRFKIKTSTPFESFILEKDAIPLLSEGAMLYSQDDYVIIDNDVTNYTYVRKVTKFESYSDEQMEAQAPTEDDNATITMSSTELVNALSAFAGVFKTGDSKVDPVHMNFKCEGNDYTFTMNYDDLITQADADVQIAEGTNTGDDFSNDFEIGTVHLKMLKEAILKDPMITVTINHAKSDEEHGLLIKLDSNSVEIYLAKALG